MKSFEFSYENYVIILLNPCAGFSERSIEEKNMDFKGKIEKKKAYLQATFHIKEIGMFGSVVKGTERERSDIDILVEFEEGYKDFFNYMRLKQCLENLLGKKVDLVMKKAIKPRLKERILNEVEYV
ncbi:MAG: nucleotidyltransferase family protein [Deltaproteobacteria bacterium]